MEHPAEGERVQGMIAVFTANGRFLADFQPIFVVFSSALRCGSNNEFAMKLNFECQNGREMSLFRNILEYSGADVVV